MHFRKTRPKLPILDGITDAVSTVTALSDGVGFIAGSTDLNFLTLPPYDNFVDLFLQQFQLDSFPQLFLDLP